MNNRRGWKWINGWCIKSGLIFICATYVEDISDKITNLNEISDETCK